MKIGFKLLDEFNNINSFDEVDQLELIQGNAYTLYFRLITIRNSDLDGDKRDLRYIPISSATVSVSFDHIDSNKVITRSATMYSQDDRSIWFIPILPTDKIQFDSMRVTLTEGSDVKTLVALSTLTQSPTDSGRFFC